MALGASTGHIVRITISRLAALTVLGTAAGTVASLWTSRYVASLLYGVQPRDPANLVGGVAVLVLTAMVAASLPVRAALRTDLASTIRSN
jgi:ABC-type antimicrobial peptide transport system permease subunit